MKISLFNIFKKPVNSISDELTSKFRTPIITTYVVVWLLRNKIFIFDLFFNNSNKINKRSILESNLDLTNHTFYLELIYTFLISIGILIFYYFFLNVSRILTVISEERLKLNLLDKLKSKSISSIDETTFWMEKSDKLAKVNRDLESEINTLRESNKYYKGSYEDYEKRIKSSNKNSEDTIQSIRKIVDEFSRNVKTTKDNPIISNLIQSIETEYKRYEKVKKGPTFITT